MSRERVRSLSKSLPVEWIDTGKKERSAQVVHQKILDVPSFAYGIRPPTVAIGVERVGRPGSTHFQ